MILGPPRNPLTRRWRVWMVPQPPATEVAARWYRTWIMAALDASLMTLSDLLLAGGSGIRYEIRKKGGRR